MTDENPNEEGSDESIELELAGDFYSILQRERAAEAESYRKYTSNPHYVEHLQQAVQAFRSPVTVAVGSLVQWKTFLKGAPFPEYGAPAVVVELLEHPRVVDETGNPLPHPVDVFIGFLDGAQELRIVGTDSRRLAPWDIDTASPS